MIPAVAAVTNHSISRALPCVARAKTTNRNKNHHADTDGVRKRNTARATKSANSGIVTFVSFDRRSYPSTASANNKYTARKIAAAVRDPGTDISIKSTSARATKMARARVTWRSRYNRSAVSRGI